MKYRFVIARSVFCRPFGHYKAATACDAKLYSHCEGCIRRKDEHKIYRGRTQLVVESNTPPGTGYVGHVLVVDASGANRTMVPEDLSTAATLTRKVNHAKGRHQRSGKRKR